MNKRLNHAVISVGSNIDPDINIDRARKYIKREHVVVSESKYIETVPIGITEQPNFVNGVILIETEMNRERLREWLKSIEKKLCRIKNGKKCGPRTIDLDIVVWNGVIVDEDVHQRPYLKAGINQVMPDLCI